MTEISIRAGSVSDLADIMPVMRAAFDPRFGEAWTEAQCVGVLSVPGSDLLIAVDAAVIGFALSRVVIDECELMLIAVDPADQGRGIGRALLNDMMAAARRSGAKTVFLEMRAENRAVHLYSSAGFVEVGRRTGYYRGFNGETFDAVTYRCELT